MEERLSAIMFFFKKSFWETFNILTKSKTIIMPSRIMKQMPVTAEFNFSLPDSHHTTPGFTFLLLYRQNFKMYLEIRVSLILARLRGPYISGL